jgi:hypothetical protein
VQRESRRSAKRLSAAHLDDLLFEEAYLNMQAEARGTPRAVGPMQSTYPKEYAGARELVVGVLGFVGSMAVAELQARQLSGMLDDDDEGCGAIGATTVPGGDFVRGVMLRRLATLTREKAHPRRGTTKVSDEVLLNLCRRAKQCRPNSGLEAQRQHVLSQLAQRRTPLGRSQLIVRMKKLGI